MDFMYKFSLSEQFPCTWSRCTEFAIIASLFLSLRV